MPVYPEIDDARATRFDTLALIDGLDQEQIEYRPPARWSLSEVLDHLVKVDVIYLGELERLMDRKRKGKLPFLYRPIDKWVKVPLPLRPMTYFAEMPVAFANTFLPSIVRHRLVGDRRFATKSPTAIQPEARRSLETLREELHAYVDRLDEIEHQTDLDLRKLYYYNPIVGLTHVTGALRFVARHEKRHQDQIRDILSSSGFPRVF